MWRPIFLGWLSFPFRPTHPVSIGLTRLRERLKTCLRKMIRGYFPAGRHGDELMQSIEIREIRTTCVACSTEHTIIGADIVLLEPARCRACGEPITIGTDVAPLVPPETDPPGRRLPDLEGS